VTAVPTSEARSFWLAEVGVGEIRTEPVPDPGPEDVLVRTRFSGISRGTETLVFTGRVPPSEADRMRAPFQAGDFPAPVKYGYLNVGVVESGPDGLAGRTVFCLYPHQTAYVVPAAAVVPVPESVPASRAVLAGAVETAVNALWDAAPLVGDRVAVVGAGVIGCAIARLAAGIPGARVTLLDVDPARRELAAALGVDFARPGELTDRQDTVFHASATGAGLQTALDLLGPEGVVTELSWYGDREIRVRLGGAFHSQRLAVRASQVGLVAPARRGTHSTTDRLRLALDLLADPAFDALLADPEPFTALPDVLARLAARPPAAPCQLISY
jgi:threonine dehydrogenase-like Zn-dependent dehydrogenase